MNDVEKSVNKLLVELEGYLPKLINFGMKIILAIILVFVGKFVIKFILSAIDKFFKRTGTEVSVRKFLNSLFKAILYGILVVIVCTQLGIPEGSFVALIGSAGIAIGLALQSTLSNFAGGVLILILKPFKVGDYVREDNNKNEGTVTKIDLFYTYLMTPDNQTIVVPNGTLSNSSLTNVTHNPKRRVDVSVGISYKADIAKAKEVLFEVLHSKPAVLPEEDIIVFVADLGHSEVTLNGRAWVKSEEYWNTRFVILEDIKIAFDKNGIEIPYNQMDIHIISEDEKK